MCASMSSAARSLRFSRALIAVGAIAASMLCYEILLTRLSSLRFQFHFSFLIVSNALLGMGASGTWIALQPDRWREADRDWIGRLCGAYVIALGAAFATSVWLPVHAGGMDAAGFASLSLYNLVTGVPFFFGGAVIGGLLTAFGPRVHRLYAIDLISACGGCLLAVGLLHGTGATGTWLGTVALASVGWLTVTDGKARWIAVAILAAVVGPIISGVRMPTKDARVPMEVTWTALSRIDVVAVPADERRIRGVGRSVVDRPLPPQVEILQDGTASTFATDFSGHPDALTVLDRSLYAPALSLKETPSVLVIGVGGGNDVWAARRAGARRIRGVELHRPVLGVHRGLAGGFSRDLVVDPVVSLEVGEGRSALLRDREHYDVVQMSGIDTWAALASGAYMLAENYLYTQEGFRAMVDRLAPGGVVQITRMAAEMETLRLLTTWAAVLDGAGADEFERVVAVLRAPEPLVATLIKPDGFQDGEVDALERFAASAGLEVLYLPGRAVGGVVEEFVRSADRADFIDRFPRDIRPTSDDRPYFFHFTRWSDPVGAVGGVTEPTYISQGNPFFIVLQFLFSALVAGLAMVLPLRWGPAPTVRRGVLVTYFGAVGLGFIALELSLMAKLTLLLGHPMWSLAVTLSVVLGFAGLGSFLSRDWALAGAARWLVPLSLLVWIGMLEWSDARVVEWTLAAPAWIRFGCAVSMLAPVGLLMGIPFAAGIRRLGSPGPNRTPTRGGGIAWAWAINGFATVIGAILAIIGSINLGFDAVMLLAVLCYLVAFAVFPGLGTAQVREVSRAP